MFAHNTEFEHAIAFSRFDAAHFLSTHAKYSFELEGQCWASIEHYYQTIKYVNTAYAQRIAAAPSAQEAYRLGNVWWRRKRTDLKAVRKTLMTRAIYSTAIQNSDVASALLETGDQLIIENSAYQHFWGIGRDQRGENQLGKIWMDVRQKLREKSQQAQGE